MTLKELLANLDLETPVMEQARANPELHDLVLAYDKQALAENRTPVTEETTGQDFKDLIDKLSNIQLMLSFCACKHQTVTLATEDPRVRDERRLKIWVIKGSLILAAIMILIVVGAVIVVGVQSGHLTDGPFVDTVLRTATEIIQLIFSTGFSGV